MLLFCSEVFDVDTQVMVLIRLVVEHLQEGRQVEKRITVRIALRIENRSRSLGEPVRPSEVVAGLRPVINHDVSITSNPRVDFEIVRRRGASGSQGAQGMLGDTVSAQSVTKELVKQRSIPPILWLPQLGQDLDLLRRP